MRSNRFFPLNPLNQLLYYLELAMDVQYLLTVVFGLVALGIFLFTRYSARNDDYWKKRGITYAPRMSLFSFFWALYKTPMHELIQDAYKKYGRVYGRFEFSSPALNVADPDLLRDILVKDFHIFNTRRLEGMDFNDEVFNSMVTVLNGEDWKRVRTIITPAFTSRKMRKMTHIINSSCETVLQTLSEHSDKEIAVDCRKVYGAFTMDVIASSAFATKIDSHNDANNPFVVNAKEAFSGAALFRMFLVLLFPPKFWKIFRIQPLNTKPMNFFKSVTLQVIKERRQKCQKGNDFLQLMLDASEEVIEGERKVEAFRTIDTDEEDHFGRIDIDSNITYTTKKLSQDEIIAQCVLFFMVGYETSALTLSFLTYNLALNPECQDKLIKEVDEVFEKNTAISYEDVRDMKYLDSCLSESLRLFPPLVMSERSASEDYKLGDTGITVTRGMVVATPIYAIHHDPEFYPEPEKFDPERFMGDNRLSRNPYTYLPFGAGPRNCLGMRFALMEIKLAISNILRHYKFSPAPETKVPLDFSMSMGFLSTKELPLLVERRRNA